MSTSRRLLVVKCSCRDGVQITRTPFESRVSTSAAFSKQVRACPKHTRAVVSTCGEQRVRADKRACQVKQHHLKHAQEKPPRANWSEQGTHNALFGRLNDTVPARGRRFFRVHVAWMHAAEIVPEQRPVCFSPPKLTSVGRYSHQRHGISVLLTSSWLSFVDVRRRTR